MEKTIMDVSRHQGVIDWAKVKASGKVDGVMIRAWATAVRARPASRTSTPISPATTPSAPA